MTARTSRRRAERSGTTARTSRRRGDRSGTTARTTRRPEGGNGMTAQTSRRPEGARRTTAQTSPLRGAERRRPAQRLLTCRRRGARVRARPQQVGAPRRNCMPSSACCPCQVSSAWWACRCTDGAWELSYPARICGCYMRSQLLVLMCRRGRSSGWGPGRGAGEADVGRNRGGPGVGARPHGGGAAEAQGAVLPLLAAACAASFGLKTPTAY